MPNWHDVLQEISATAPNAPYESPLDIVRRKYLAKLARYTKRNVIAYYSGFLSKPQEASVFINDDDKNGFMLCVHELNKSKGLDLILHTPGGTVAATQSIIHYIQQMFGKNVRVIVPQIAMSGGTMIACASKSIVMGKHSNLGPCDPQVDGYAAKSVKMQFQEMYDEIMSDARAADVWGPMLKQLGPSFLKDCDLAIEWAEDFVEMSLAENMFSTAQNPREKANITRDKLLDVTKAKGHDRHFHIDDCIDMGLEIEKLENDQKLQDLVLTVHHCFMHTLANSAAAKIIENHKGRALIKNVTSGFLPFLQLGGPPAGGGMLGNFGAALRG